MGRGVNVVFWCSASVAGVADCEVVVGATVAPAAAWGGAFVMAWEGAGGGGGRSSVGRQHDGLGGWGDWI